MYKRIIARLIAAEYEKQYHIHNLIKNGDIDTIKDIINNDASIVNSKIDDMPIVSAAYLYEKDDENFRIMELLLSKGANPTVKDSDNLSLLDRVKKFGNKNAMKILMKYGWLKDIHIEDETGKAILEKFEWQGFNVINAGINENRMKEALNLLKPIIAKMKKYGFGNLLYGPLIVTGEQLKGQKWDHSISQWVGMKAAAYYSINKDLIVFNVDWFTDNASSAQTFAHELAHRHWYKFMDQSQRQLWAGKYEERGVKIQKAHLDYIVKLLYSCTPDKTNDLGYKYKAWNEFDYDRFLKGLSAKQEKYKLRDIFDTIVAKHYKTGNELPGNIKTLRRQFVEDVLIDKNGETVGGPTWYVKKMDLIVSYILGRVSLNDLPRGIGRIFKDEPIKEENRKDFYEKHVKKNIDYQDSFIESKIYNTVEGKFALIPTSSSEYGATISEEDYAEAFGNFFANWPMPREIFDLFARINKLKLAKNHDLYKKNKQLPCY